MFLGISSDTEVERGTWMLDGGAVNEEAFVELVDLLYQFRRMGIASRCRRETLVLACLVAAEEHEVVDAEYL